ncbi:hypothetical protein [uncultured Kocuria sp.]|uniref:hypothetical protein n=1 Tax=uncultured Kocuria sp. TaxID=259305 RepID=UPI00263041C0|nr:hypothetical protein [uncultured Kocuria sp.]
MLRREQDTGKQTSRTDDDQREAVMFEDFLDANGKSFRLAPRSAAEFRPQAPNRADAVPGHLEALTGVESGTRAGDERMAAKHLDTDPAQGNRGPRSSRRWRLRRACTEEDMAGRELRDLVCARPGGGQLRNGWINPPSRQSISSTLQLSN